MAWNAAVTAGYVCVYFKGIYVYVYKILSAYICAHRLDVGFAKLFEVLTTQLF